MNHPSSIFMNHALTLASKFPSVKKPVASIIVRNNDIVSKGVSTMDIEQDCTCHAEMNAIREACKMMKSKYLFNCIIYSTFEPCPMCTSAVIWAKMSGIVFGAKMDDRNEKIHQRILISCTEIVKYGTPKVIVFPSFMREECLKIYQ